MAGQTLTTERLAARPVEADDLEGLLAVRQSNQERLLRTEGSEGEPGRYTIEMLERDVMLADLDPARLFLAIRKLVDREPVIGLVDMLVANPSDNHPWLGSVEITAIEQRKGFGREAALAATEFLLSQGASGRAVRAAIDGDDAAAQAFAAACGFVRSQSADVALRDGQMLFESPAG
ncbi:MAG TPA: GNAT family protein [Nocardioidaceae bacterium]|nr:GNAT family protein [Nocardioidaceae bacterium]